MVLFGAVTETPQADFGDVRLLLFSMATGVVDLTLEAAGRTETTKISAIKYIKLDQSGSELSIRFEGSGGTNIVDVNTSFQKLMELARGVVSGIIREDLMAMSCSSELVLYDFRNRRRFQSLRNLVNPRLRRKSFLPHSSGGKPPQSNEALANFEL